MNRYQPRAARLAYGYLRDAAEAEEAVQDAFMKAFLCFPSCRNELRFDLWFARIVVNCCLDRLAARTRRRRWFSPFAGTEQVAPERGPSPEGAMLARERRQRLLDAVAGLPRQQRSVVLLGPIEGHSTREIATILGVNEATVRVHLFRAIRALRRVLHYDPLPAGAAGWRRMAV